MSICEACLPDCKPCDPSTWHRLPEQPSCQSTSSKEQTIEAALRRSRCQLGAEVAVQDLDALQPGAVASLQALPGARQALLRRGQALLIPQLEEAPAHVQ